MKLRLVTLATIVVWIAAAAGGLAWLLPLAGRPTPVPPQAVLATQPPVAIGGAERLLGTPPPVVVAAAPTPAEESRFKLLGVIAPRAAGGSGLALISVDGRPARVVAVGREVDTGLRVLTVSLRRVDLGSAPGAPTTTLELPPMAEPTRGVPGGAPLMAAPNVAGPGPSAALPMPVPGATLPVPMPGVNALAARQRAAPMLGGGSPAVVIPNAPMPGMPGEQQADTVPSPSLSPSEGRTTQ